MNNIEKLLTVQDNEYGLQLYISNQSDLGNLKYLDVLVLFFSTLYDKYLFQCLIYNYMVRIAFICLDFFIKQKSIRRTTSNQL